MFKITSTIIIFASIISLTTSAIASDQMSAAALTFAVIGDYGDNSVSEKKIAELVDKREPEFIITMGDNNYPGGCWETIDENIGQYYSKYIGNYKGKYGKGANENRFYPSLGNHDWYAADKCLYKGGLPYLTYFSLPNNGMYYDFRKGRIHFFAIDSDRHEPDGNKMRSRQYAWLKHKISESDACYKIVYFHHAAYTSGEHRSNKDMQWDFSRLGVDAVLSGHDHHYERIMRDGIVYYVNGSGGAGLRKIEDKVRGSVYHYDDKHGYMMGYLTDDKLTFNFYNEDNDKKDSYTIKKRC